MKIAVITPTLPERTEFLEECMKNISHQTLQPDFHLIGRDYLQGGHYGNMVPIRNALVGAAESLGCDWAAFYDDDDLLHPKHLEVLASHAEGADAVYSWGCDDEDSRQDLYKDFDKQYLEKHNYIAVTSLVRIEAYNRIGGFRKIKSEEWDFWKRLADSGATIKCANQVTWTYRRSGARR